MAIASGKRLGELARGEQAELYVAVDEAIARRARDGQPFFILRVSDLTATANVYIFPDRHAFDAARRVERGDVVKLRAVVDKATAVLELKGLELQIETALTADLLAGVFGRLRPEACAVARGDIGFDLETVARIDIDELPPRERAKFMRAALVDASRESGAKAPAPEAIQAAVSKQLALHPLTTRIVSVAYHSLQAGDELAVVTTPCDDLELPAIATSEEEMLEMFWALARRARRLIGFNSRRFDVPVLLARSAMLGVSAPVDLSSPWRHAEGRHVDLYDVLRAHGAADDRRVSLELAAFAFGIPVKQSGHGGDVAALWAAGRLQELATYNLEDARATALLYQRLRGTWV